MKTNELICVVIRLLILIIDMDFANRGSHGGIRQEYYDRYENIKRTYEEWR